MHDLFIYLFSPSKGSKGYVGMVTYMCHMGYIIMPIPSRGPKKKKKEKNGVDQEALLWPSFLLPLYELEYASYLKKKKKKSMHATFYKKKNIKYGGIYFSFQSFPFCHLTFPKDACVLLAHICIKQIKYLN